VYSELLRPIHFLVLAVVLGTTTNILAADPPEVAVLKAAGANVHKLKTGGMGVSFSQCKLDDKGWQALESLPDLKSFLCGSAKEFRDEQLARLCKIKTLESIIFNDFGGTDEGLKALAALPNLRHFGADHTPCTGSFLSALKDSKNLTSLRFGGCLFNDEGMKALGELAQVKEVDISHLRFTSEGFPSLARCTSLEKLTIAPQFHPYYVGADFVHLSRLPNFNTLVVSEMALTYDNGLDHLKGLKLKHVRLRDCRVSDADLQKLKAALPDAKIELVFSLDENFKRWDEALERRKKGKGK
jgi:hypothetical protein